MKELCSGHHLIAGDRLGLFENGLKLGFIGCRGVIRRYRNAHGKWRNYR